MPILWIVFKSYFHKNFPFKTTIFCLSQFISALAIDCAIYFYKLIQSINVDLRRSSSHRCMTMLSMNQQRFRWWWLIMNGQIFRWMIHYHPSNLRFFCCAIFCQEKKIQSDWYKSYPWCDFCNHANCNSDVSKPILTGKAFLKNQTSNA